MAKISPVSGKYIINATIKIDGVVDRPDIIGAIFGQTEGLLGSELELRELQRSGRIGRIEVNTESKAGKTTGTIVIPSSLDKAETVIVGAALEVIERIGPCNSHITVGGIEDVRISKRKKVIERAKELLKNMQDTILPDSQELAEQVAESVRVMEIGTYGREKLPAGPAVEDSEEIIVVEGRADVVTLLKHGFKNAIAMNGSSVPKTLAELCKTKTVTLFVDGDRGGLLNIKEMISVTDVEFIVKAPDGKEVEELTKKEIHKALRTPLTPEQMKHELSAKDSLRPKRDTRRNDRNDRPERSDRNTRSDRPERNAKVERPVRTPKITEKEKEAFTALLEELVGSHAAALLDKQFNTLGKVPLSEVGSTVEGLDDSVHAIVLDGAIDKDTYKIAEKSRVRFIAARESTVKVEGRTAILIIE